MTDPTTPCPPAVPPVPGESGAELARLRAEVAALREAAQLAQDALSGAVTTHSNSCAAMKRSYLECDCWLVDRRRALAALARTEENGSDG